MRPSRNSVAAKLTGLGLCARAVYSPTQRNVIDSLVLLTYRPSLSWAVPLSDSGSHKGATPTYFLKATESVHTLVTRGLSNAIRPLRNTIAVIYCLSKNGNENG